MKRTIYFRPGRESNPPTARRRRTQVKQGLACLLGGFGGTPGKSRPGFDSRLVLVSALKTPARPFFLDLLDFDLGHQVSAPGEHCQLG